MPLWLTILLAILIVLLVSYLLIKNPKVSHSTLKGSYGIEEVKKIIPKDINFSASKVTTKDGYILKTFNLRHKSKYNPDYPPILFMHGVSSSACNFMTNGDKQSPAYILARLG